MAMAMAGGAFVNTGTTKDYPGELVVFFTCIVAATGGLIFGYHIRISGGVTSMDSFLLKFSPLVYRKEKEKFDSQVFTSSLELIASFFALAVTRVFDQKWSMFGGGITFLTGAALNGFAKNVLMLILGRILLGIGVGFANQSVRVYLSEMAPATLRGMVNIGFQLMIAIVIFAANLINHGTAKIEAGWGWHISLVLAAVPAGIITLGSLFLPDTPYSLIERGHDEKAKTMLRRIRGTDDILEEYNDLAATSEKAKLVKHPWRNIVQRKYRPQLTMAILIPFFQQLTGINVIMFNAPVLFKTIGFGGDAALMSSVIVGLVNVFATLVSIFTVDKLSRQKLFLLGGSLMLVCQIVVGTLIAIKIGTSGQANPSKPYAAFVVLFICVYVAGFAWSWGPLGWLVPGEILPLEIRSAGQSISDSVNILLTFIIAQAFLTMLCQMKFGLFYFFGGWVVIVTTFIALFLPETKEVPIEEMILVWKAHWFWRNFIADEDIIERGSSRI